MYESICEDRKSRRDQYGPGSGLHAHHILPRHIGGGDEESNITYLTVREHKIVHFLLWKIHRSVNDLRSMHMLGANLSIEKRRIIGRWCYENKIGWHKYTKEEKSLMAKQQRLDRIANGKENEWDFWTSEEGWKLRCSIGGKKGGKTTSSKRVGGWFLDEEKHREFCKKGGATSPKLPVFDTQTKIVKKFYTEQERMDFLEKNPTFILGYGPSACDISKKPKFPCFNNKTNDIVHFITKEERTLFLEQNPEWIAGRKPFKNKVFPVYNVKTLEKTAFYTKEDALMFVDANPDWTYGRRKSTRKSYAHNVEAQEVKSFQSKEERDEFLTLNLEWSRGRSR